MASQNLLESISTKLFEAGTSDYLAGLITKPWDQMLEAVRATADYLDSKTASSPPLDAHHDSSERTSYAHNNSARCHGIYLEGPFISPLHKGAHNVNDLISPSPTRIAELIDAAKGYLRMVTIAPELEHGMEAVETLTRHGVVAAFGHSDADYDTTKESITLGQKHFTHLFNAMNPIHHRNPGPVVAALEAYQSGEDITVEVINDGIHLHPSIVEWAFDSFNHQHGTHTQTGVVLITDSMSATLLGDGEYRLGSLNVEVKNGKAVLAGTNTIAGSTLTLSKGVQNTAALGINPELIAQAYWTNPVRLFGDISMSERQYSQGSQTHK